MILVFPQATKLFNQFIQELNERGLAEKFLDKSVGSYDLESISKVVLIVLRNQLVESLLKDYFSSSSEVKNYEIVVLERETAGSICSILMATPLLNNESIIISALDQVMLGQKLNFNDFVGIDDADVVALTHRSSDPRLCYTLKDEAGTVIQLFEKKVVSVDAILGVYLIRDFSQFLAHCHELLIKFRGFQERIFYTSDVINSYIGQGSVCYFPSLDFTYVKVRSIDDVSRW